MTRKFIIWVETNKIGSRCETEVELEEWEVPENWEGDKQFNDDMLDDLWGSGLVEWGVKEIEA